jgi:[ribosomal protein S18]-alanine N-acetyltransferase
MRHHVGMELRPFDPTLAERVASWTTGPDEVNAWSSRFDDQVPPEVIVGWSAADDVEAYVAVVDSEVIAYGELWLDDDEGEVELARLLLDPARRGRGLGKAFTRALVDRARQEHPDLPHVILRFRPDNVVARRTYAGVGFVELDAEEAAVWNEGQRTTYVWMRLP